MVRAVGVALRTLWNDRCAIIEFHPVVTSYHATEHRPVVVREDEACKLSFSAMPHADQTETGATLSGRVTLFLDPEIIIKAGSKIVVTRGEQTFHFTQSGIAKIFSHHQEVELSPYEEYA